MIKDYFLKQVKSNLPYLPNVGQEKMLEALCDFLFEGIDESLFLLTGYAGTGKTSLVGALVKTLGTFQRKAVLLAPTGRAAKVFSLYAGHAAYTIHKKIYRQRSFTGDYDGFQITDNLHKNTLFIVDEASMISNISSDTYVYGSGCLLDDLIEYVYSGEGCRLILLGDRAQLPPVGQENSPALDKNVLSGYGLQVFDAELHTVARQAGDSGILFNATHLREQMFSDPSAIPHIWFSSFQDIEKVSGEFLVETISTAYDRDGMDETIVITRSNKRANIFNQGIRNQILYRDEELTAGDMLLIAKNNYFWSEKYKEIDFIANGDVARVVKVRNTREMYGFRFADVALYFPDYEVEIECKIILDTLSTEAPALTSEMNNRLFMSVYEDYFDITTKREKLKKVKIDPWYNALQVKYAYAVTCHKAQGGQWKNVFIDMGYIRTEFLGLDFYRWLYTAFTRSSRHLYIINPAEEFCE
ncbi:ATP-dependent DNA helicase [Coprobacter tertius]|uniref:AAA family ATPase n=1 Tax=Coprobacter tertius TaxID=2944915 RepID=A0ABT1ME12_9BACT|nr:AAA family ATPase [Coprobacter tertius]MCP9610870.1 AAA family ATPase [Coprobacter tertius]